MRELLFQAGITALLLATAALLALVALFPVLPLSTCIEVAHTGTASSGSPALDALEVTELVYTPDDGVNECSIHVAVPGVPIALLGLGGLLVAASLFRDR